MNRRNKLALIILIAVLVSVIGGYLPSKPEEKPNQREVFGESKASYLDSARESPFASNDFGIPWRVAEVIGVATVEEMVKEIETRKIPHFKELGVRWARLHPNTFATFGWSGVDPDRDGKNLDFFKQDALVRLVQENNISLIAVISPLPRDIEWLEAESYVPEDKEAYFSYVEQLVERYDGDGINDMPGLKYPIRYWQLENEPDLHNRVRAHNNPNFCSPDEYFEVLKLTYRAIRKADEEAKVIINLVGVGQGVGNTSINYLRRLNELGVEDYYDIFSYHIYPQRYDTYVLKENLRKFKELVGKKPIWITESGINGRSENEKEQAAWIVKHHVYHLANGIKKIVWLTFTDMSPKVPERTVAKYSGLLSFQSTPKLSYYTYKKMVEVLEGSDWDSIHTIQENDIYIYRFTKNENYVWVVWKDKPGMERVRITLDVKAKDVKIFEAVPKYKTGREVRNYDTAFKEITANVLESNSQLEFEIGDVPVFVEMAG
jgi:hypothetical protein